MAVFQRSQLTAYGSARIAQAHKGQRMVFTQIGLGDGFLPEILQGVTQLANEKQRFDIAKESVSGNAFWASCVPSDIEDPAGIFVREIGLYIADPFHEGDRSFDKLYSVANVTASLSTGQDFLAHVPQNPSGVIVDFEFALHTIVSPDVEINIIRGVSGPGGTIGIATEATLGVVRSGISPGEVSFDPVTGIGKVIGGRTGTGPTPPTASPASAPAHVMAIPLSAYTIQVNWEPVERATSYKVYYGSDPNPSDYVEVESVVKNFIGLVPESTHYYKVVAVNAIGQSGPSEVVSATTLKSFKMTGDIIPKGTTPRNLAYVVLGREVTGPEDVKKVSDAIGRTIEQGCIDNIVTHPGDGDYFGLASLNIPNGPSGQGAFSATLAPVPGGHGRNLDMVIVAKNPYLDKLGNKNQHVFLMPRNLFKPAQPIGPAFGGHRMNSSNTNAGGYLASEGRQFVINELRSALIEAGIPDSCLLPISRRITNGSPATATAADIIKDDVFLPSVYEVFGSNLQSSAVFEAPETQSFLTYFSDGNLNHRRKRAVDGTESAWWTASPVTFSTAFGLVGGHINWHDLYSASNGSAAMPGAMTPLISIGCYYLPLLLDSRNNNQIREENLLKVLDVNTPLEARKELTRLGNNFGEINNTGLPFWSGLHIGMFLDLLMLDGGKIVFTHNVSYKNLRVRIAGFNHYKNQDNPLNHIVWEFAHCPFQMPMRNANTNDGGYPKAAGDVALKPYLEGPFLDGLKAVIGDCFYPVKRRVTTGSRGAWTRSVFEAAIFPLSRNEIRGDNPFEGNDLPRLPIYEAGITRVKNFNGSATPYLTSTPATTTADSFTRINIVGQAVNSQAAADIGVAPAFVTY
jgi:hypothetical protein